MAAVDDEFFKMDKTGRNKTFCAGNPTKNIFKRPYFVFSSVKETINKDLSFNPKEGSLRPQNVVLRLMTNKCTLIGFPVLVA